MACVADVLEEIGFEPVPAGSGGLRARNCPFDPLSRSNTEVVCRLAHAIVRGVIEGVGATTLGLRRDAQTDTCCVLTEPLTIRPP